MGFFNPKSAIDDAEPEVCPVPQGGWSTRVNKLFLPAAKHVKTLYCYLRVSKVRVRVSQPLLNPNPNPSSSPSPNPNPNPNPTPTCASPSATWATPWSALSARSSSVC